MGEVRLGTIAGLAALLTVALAGAALAAPPGWGIDAYSAAPGFIEKAEQAMHHPFSSYAIYTDLDSAGSFPNTGDADHAIAVDALIYLNINSYQTVAGRKSVVCWPSVANGRHDIDILAWIAALKLVHYPRMIVTFNHEPTVFENPNQPKCPSDTPSSYKAAFRHVHHMFTNAGLHYRFAFVTTASQFRSGGAYQYMPKGDFQVVGADGYNRFRYKYKTPSYIFAPVHRWAVEHRMPLLVGEIGSVLSDRTAAWISAAAALLKSYGDVIAVNWNSNRHYRLDQRTDQWHHFLAAAKTYLWPSPWQKPRS